MIATSQETHSRHRESSDAVVASLEGVSRNYGEVRALRNVNFTVHAGEVVALLGPNGAGKTTAVKLLLGLLPPDSGNVRVFGGNPTNPENRMRTGAMLQVGKVPETLRVCEHIDLFSSYYPQPLPIQEVLQAAGLEKLSDRKFGDLSGGQRQRTLFALAICGNPDLLFLDEPTVGSRCGSPARALGRNSPPGRARKNCSAHHSLSGRGRRSRQSHSRDSSGRDHRRRHARRNQVANQRQAHPLRHRVKRDYVAANSRRHRRQVRSRSCRNPYRRSGVGGSHLTGSRSIAFRTWKSAAPDWKKPSCR